MNTQSIAFTASEQTLTKTSGADTYASNTVGYIEAAFDLDTNWGGFDSVRAVWKSQYYTISAVLDAYGKCLVPAEVKYYKSKVFVNLVGSNVEDDVLVDRLTTYPVLAFTIDAEAEVEGTETTDITPSQFEQFVDQVEGYAESAAEDAQSIAESAAQIEQNAEDIADLKEDIKGFTGIKTPSWETGGLYVSTGLDYESPNIKTDFIDVNSNYKYIIKKPSNIILSVFEYNDSKAFIQKFDYTNIETIKYTTSANAKFVRFLVQSDPSDLDNAAGIIMYDRYNRGVINTFTLNTGGIINSGEYTELSDVPVGKIYALISSVINAMNDAPKSNSSTGATIFSTGAENDDHNGSVQFVYYFNGDAYYRNCSSNTFTEWFKIITNNDVNDILGVAGTFEGSFTQIQQQINTGITLKADTEYYIKADINPRVGQWNLFGSGNANNYIILPVFYDGVNFKNDSTDRNLIVYNGDSQTEDIKLTVYTKNSVKKATDEAVKIYRVGKKTIGGTRFDYESVTECLLDLKDDYSNKIIEIWEGTYNIYQEYIDAQVPVYTGSDPLTDFYDYCVWVPKNTHIIGKGLVKLIWAPDPTVNPIMPAQCKCVSPLNTAGNCTIENIEVYCKNGRYTLHNDSIGKAIFTGAVQTYINCKFYKYANDVDQNSEAYGLTSTTGFGIDRAMKHRYINCVFTNEAGGRAFYGHARSTVDGVNLLKEMSGEIILENCAIEAPNNPGVKLGNVSNTNIQIKTMFNNCHINKRIDATSETGNATRNAFDMTFINCDNVTVHIEDSDTNRYPPIGYGTTITES